MSPTAHQLVVADVPGFPGLDRMFLDFPDLLDRMFLDFSGFVPGIVVADVPGFFVADAIFWIGCSWISRVLEISGWPDFGKLDSIFGIRRFREIPGELRPEHETPYFELLSRPSSHSLQHLSERPLLAKK